MTDRLNRHLSNTIRNTRHNYWRAYYKRFPASSPGSLEMQAAHQRNKDGRARAIAAAYMKRQRKETS